MRPAIVSGNVTGNAPVSYWPVVFSLFLVTIPEVFAKVNSAQFPSRSLERWRHFTTTTRIRFVFPFIFKFGNPSDV